MSSDVNSTNGKLILILGPSGSGKGTIMHYLKKEHPEFVFPPSYTTRDPRPGEIEGDIYHYVSREEFDQLIENDDLLEWAIVHEDNYYGTNRKEIEAGLAEGKVVIREVDIQGVESIWEKMGKENVETLFITAKTWDDLQERILDRADMSEEELEKRQRSYEKETEFAEQCDYVLYNEYRKKDEAFADVENALSEIIQ